MARVRVLIRGKAGVFDPEGAVILASLGRLGFDDVSAARVVKVIELELDLPSRAEVEAEVARMCDALLVNPVMQEYTIEHIE